MLEQTVEWLQQLIISQGLAILGSIAILIIGRWLARLIVRAAERLMHRAEVDRALSSFMTNLLYYVLLALIAVAALNNIGVSMTSVIAVLGALTLAIGLALQDSIGNLASGWLIVFLHPYKAGDYVVLNGVTGYVREIKLFHSVLVTRDNKTILVPNKDVLSSNIVNYSETELIRLDLVFGISYGDDILLAKKILQEIVDADQRVAREPAPKVAVKELGDSSVNLVARPYVHESDEVSVAFAVTEQVKLRFDAAGITIPFPQRDLHLYQESSA